MQTAPPATASVTATPAEAPQDYVVQRPPPGLARGSYAAPPWLIAILACALVAAIVAFFVVRHRRHQRSRRYHSVGPTSVPPSSRR